MRFSQAIEICRQLDLGCPISLPQRVTGGFVHWMWRLKTSKSTYAIKQLSQHRNNSHIYEITENIAFEFQKRGIPALCALKKGNTYLRKIESDIFLVYPWIDSITLDKDTISPSHALKISSLVARLHQINLQVPDLPRASFGVHQTHAMLELINQAESLKLPFSENLRAYQKKFVTINEDYQNQMPFLQHTTVLSHGDLDQKNVLWGDRQNPILIDWERAQYLNPTYEIITVALKWSGMATSLHTSLFLQMLQDYLGAGGTIDITLLKAAFHGILGTELYWMIYNIQRSCKEDNIQDQQRSLEIIPSILKNLIELEDRMFKLINLIERQLTKENYS